MYRSYSVFVWRNIAIIAVFGGGGFLLGYVFAGLFVGTLLCLIWHLLHFYDLQRWLREDLTAPPPPMQDRFWLDIQHRLLRLQQRGRKRRRKLKRVCQDFLDAISSMPDGVVLLDRDLKVEWCNRTATDFLGLDREKDKDLLISTLIRQPAFIEFINRRQWQNKVEIGAPGNPEQRFSLRLVEFGKKRYLLMVSDITEIRRVDRMRVVFV